MEIQKTTVSDRKDGKARIEIQISDKKELEQSEQSVVLSVLIDCDDAAYLLEWMQSNALTAASYLIGEVAERCERKPVGPDRYALPKG